MSESVDATEVVYWSGAPDYDAEYVVTVDAENLDDRLQKIGPTLLWYLV